jgi:GrpB-like predicted nucleotidyltransferase (UPF0157 family)
MFMAEPIIVVDYDESWPRVFESLRAHVAAALGAVAVSIEHVGSTAVPGLAAKPVIDMDVVVASKADVPIAIVRLGMIGYVHRGDLGITGRDAFLQPANFPAHHLYVCAADAEELSRHLLFRNFLRSHPDAARAYSELKQKLAEQFRDDREAYSQAKTPFILNALKG